MKRLNLLLVSLASSIILFTLSGPLKVSAADNLIPNPDVETGDTQPANFNTGSWGGTVADFTYSTTDGSIGKALGVTVTAQGNGDAKWYPDPVNVTAGTTYEFSDSYKSNVGTDIIAQYTVGSNSYQYEYLTSVGANSAWTNITANFTVPDNSTQVTIFHVISSVGQLWTDNFSLTETTSTTPTEPPVVDPPVVDPPVVDPPVVDPPVTPPAVDENQILNPSVETPDSNGNPAYWQNNAWGTNTSTFEYSNSAHTGNKSVHVTTTSYTDGDAKWYHDPVNVTPGETYNFTDYYKSTENTEVVLQYLMNDGSNQYVYLGGPGSSADWAQVDYNFTAPTNAKQVTVFHLIAGVGDLWTDDYSIILVTTPEPPPIPDPGENAVANPSVETPNGSDPAFWQSNSWGTNKAQFQYLNEGQEGSKSVYVNVTNYTDGDAKWYFDPVSISDDSHYLFSDYYKSTAPSETVVQFQMGDGSLSYLWLGTNPINANWAKSEYSFLPPVGATKLTVFHVMAQNGELWTDNYSLKEILPDGSLLPNASLEDTLASNPNQPQFWNTNSWGTNNAKFQYLNTGYDGTHSVKTTITNYTDGDAKWFNDSINLTPGVSYKISDYYQSDVETKVTIAVNMQDGSVNYIDIGNAAPSTDWVLFTGTFTMPANAMSINILHILQSSGFLITDNYKVEEYVPTPFNEPLVTLTFDDDGWLDNYDTAFPVLDQYGYKGNWFFITSNIQNSDLPDAVTRVQNMAADGQEIGSHTVDHADLTTLTPAQVTTELVDSQSYLESILGTSVNYFATPYGSYNQSVLDQIMHTYTVHRTVNVGFNSKDNFDVSQLKVQNVFSDTTAEDITAWINQAQQEGTWLILVYHRVATDPGTYDTTPVEFADQMAAVNNSGIKVVTISQALAELEPQL